MRMAERHVPFVRLWIPIATVVAIVAFAVTLAAPVPPAARVLVGAALSALLVAAVAEHAGRRRRTLRLDRGPDDDDGIGPLRATARVRK